MPTQERLDDFVEKVDKVRLLLKEKGLNGLLLKSVVNFAWLTGGRAYVNIADESASGKILITYDDVYLLATNNEVPRLMQEELNGYDIKIIEYPWYSGLKDDLLKKVGICLPITIDYELEQDLASLRSILTSYETEKIRWLGRKSASILEDCCRNVNIGDKEYEIAGKLSKAFWSNGIEPLVMNIAADDRAYRYRHPIPTDNSLKKHLACSICVKKWGLNVTLTRVVHFGSLEDELRKKHNAAVNIEAVAISESFHGVKVKAIFDKMKQIYKETGFDDEWTRHPIGGLIGFKPREYDVTGDSEYTLEINQAFCWNPTIQGTKSEDTILITSEGNEIITQTSDFPYIIVRVKDQKIKRPDILIR